MKSRESLMRLKRFHAEERRRRVAQIEMMILEFDRMAADLEREITNEETKSGITDQAHFAYPTYAKAARQRRDNLRRSADDLKTQLDDAKREHAEALEELKKAESLEDRERGMDRVIDPGDLGLAHALQA